MAKSDGEAGAGRRPQPQRGKRMRRLAAGLVAGLLVAAGPGLPAGAVAGDGAEAPAPVALHEVGPVTKMPLPRYVSLKASEGNARRGPSGGQKIDWVFVRRDMPLQIIGEYGNWRQVRDRDGATGWMHFALLSGVRTVLVEQDLAPLRAQPADGSAEVARLEAGVIGRLGQCVPDWCRISAGGYRGWLRKSAVWGVDADEIRN